MKIKHNLSIASGVLFFLCPLLSEAAIMRDPTLPANYKPPAQANTLGTSDTPDTSTGDAFTAFKLTAIIGTSKHRTAIINNKTYQVGDQISEFTITTITAYTVELRGQDNTRQVLSLMTQVKKPVPEQ